MEHANARMDGRFAQLLFHAVGLLDLFYAVASEGIAYLDLAGGYGSARVH